MAQLQRELDLSAVHIDQLEILLGYVLFEQILAWYIIENLRCFPVLLNHNPYHFQDNACSIRAMHTD